MEDFLKKDVIVAISTPPGRGGIGIVRMSGEGVTDIADKIIFPLDEGLFSDISPKRFIVARVKDASNGEIIDNVMSVRMKAPFSYTGEDSVEIHCHGAPYILNKTLSLCIYNGARLASPGEFTRRAFLNGRIDLMQAEAVADLIGADSRISSQCALRQLNGELGNKLDSLKEKIVDVLSALEAEIDFPEDTAEEKCEEGLKEKLDDILLKTYFLIKSADKGIVLRDGYHCVIAGKTNVGKSSLFNVILGESRSITTDTPGTTRDFITEEIEVGGYPVRVTDTAGIMDGKDDIDKESVRRSIKCLENADFVLFVVDASSPLTDEDFETYHTFSRKCGDMAHILVLNKIDLGKKINLEKVINEFKSKVYVEVSAKSETGIETLLEKIALNIENEFSGIERDVVVNIRHRKKLEEMNEYLKKALTGIGNNMSEEFLACDLKSALDCLGEIKGENYSEEILDTIFERFCIGK